MNTGKTSSAIAKLTDTSKSVFLLDEIVKVKTVEQTLIEKHPLSEPDDANFFYFNVKGINFKKVAMRTHGSHGASGLEANKWRRNLTYIGQKSN